MTDDQLSPETPETPEISEVRRLLADARHTEPMPEHVTARMDRVLAGLRDESAAAQPAGAVVVPISAHRRRRAAALLVAAAAVVVGGVVAAPHVGGDHATSGATASSAEDAAGGGTELGNTGNSGNASPPSSPTASQLHRLAPVRNGRVLVRPQSFAAAAIRGQALLRTRATKNMDLATTACVDVPQAADAVKASYERAPAVLVYRRARGGSQVVDLFVCGSTRPIRSTTLPVP